MENTQNKPQDTFKIIGNWANQTKTLKSKFSQLTNADLKMEPGKENEMLNRIEARLNKNREEVIKIIELEQPK